MNDFNDFLAYIQSPEFILIATQIITILAVVFKLASDVRTLTRKKNLTTIEVRDTLLASIPKEIAIGIEKSVNEIVMPLREDVNQIMPILKDFGKILALSQENTPESRVAILNVIQDMGKVVSADEIAKAKAIIQAQVQEASQKKDDIITAITQIADKNKPIE